MNRLQFEHSPYLISHAADPVDWYPWGRDAFAHAEAVQKPLLIALGTLPPRGKTGGTAARLIERYYVPVQVDAREHPDVAAYYLRAATLLLGAEYEAVQVLADSRGRPFFALRIGSDVELAGVLSTVALHWHSAPEVYLRTAELLDEKIASFDGADGGDMTASPQGEAVIEDNGDVRNELKNHFEELVSRFDSQYGGFGTGAKALLPQELLFLLHYGEKYRHTPARDMAMFTLEAMAQSPVRDHVGGGFFHGTRDRQWQKPLPEKRLPDQAWMLECYLTAYADTGSPLFAQAARETADFVLRELRHSAGGFYTAQWSDDGFYDAVLGAGKDPSSVVEPPAGVLPTASPRGEAFIKEMKTDLYRLRLERGSPRREEMVLVGQNGVMIAALCRAGRILGVQRYLSAALLADQFLQQRLVGLTDLRRYWCHGTTVGEGALEDYAGYALGQLELYRSGCGNMYLRRAARIMARADALFSDHARGGYYLTRGDGCLPCRPKQLWDKTVPSAWSVAVRVERELAREIRHPGLCRRAAELAAQVGADCGYGLIAGLG